ncbi:gluconolactonase [Paraburkholderia sp. MM5477-R1]
MFATPELIEATVLARLPEKFHINGRISGRFGSRRFYLEGPAVARDGTFYFTDVPWGRIFRVEPGDNQVSLVLEYDGEPNGMKVHKDGRLFVADNKNGIVIVHPATGKVEQFVSRVDNEGLLGPNDLFFSSDGYLYFTDQGQSDIRSPHGRVIRVDPEGRAEVILRDLASPNGLVLSKDEKSLFVALTKTNNIWRAPLETVPGCPFDRIDRTGLYIQLSGGNGPDGMATDSAGNLIVAHAGLGAVWVFNPIGEPIYRINTTEVGLHAANITYGGEDNKLLYIIESSSGSILTARMPVTGKTMYSHMV